MSGDLNMVLNMTLSEEDKKILFPKLREHLPSNFGNFDAGLEQDFLDYVATQVNRNKSKGYLYGKLVSSFGEELATSFTDFLFDFLNGHIPRGDSPVIPPSSPSPIRTRRSERNRKVSTVDDVLESKPTHLPTSDRMVTNTADASEAPVRELFSKKGKRKLAEASAVSNPSPVPQHEQPKKNSRCRFWPGSCQKGDSCPFAHPTTLCSFWPKCTKGAQCMYLHPEATPSAFKKPRVSANTPACRYADKCTRADCTFSHAPVTAKPCRFDERCSNASCKFQHPNRLKNATETGTTVAAVCRYDDACTAIGCKFKHPQRDAKEEKFKEKTITFMEE